MGSSEQTPSAILDRYFEQLDSAEFSPQTIFKSEANKEYYETLLMYAFRKYRASVYHLDNVRRLLREEETSLENAPSPVIPPELKGKLTRLKLRVSRSAHHYVYELSAFLGALKGSVDFLATICSEHISGVKADSIRTFIRRADAGDDHVIYDVIRKHINWLKDVREYRDHLVHRLVITTDTGHEIHLRKSQVVKVKYPVVIPQKTPKYIPDTRRARGLEEVPRGLSFDSTEEWSDLTDSTDEIMSSIEVRPADDYVQIEEFMEMHLANYELFFADIIQNLSILHFKTV